MNRSSEKATRKGTTSLRFASAILRRTRISRTCPTGTGAAAFADAVCARQASVVRRVTPLAFVQRQARMRQWLALTHRHWHLTFMPRLQLQLASSTKEASAETAPAFAPPRAAEPPQVGPTFVSTLVRPIELRSERVDSIRFHSQAIQSTAAVRIERTAATVHAATPAARDARAPRVHRVAGSAAPKGRDVTAATAQRHDVATAAAPVHSPEPAPQLARAADLNIDRLADRVVHAIDRRLVAQRERHGRL